MATILAAAALGGRLSPTIDAFASFLPFAPLLVLIALLLGGRRPGAFVILATLYVLIASAVLIVPELWNGPVSTSPVNGRRLVIVSHNVGYANVDPDRTVRELGATDADILLLQETDGSVAPFLKQLETRFPYRNACVRRCSLAIFSRLPLDRVRYRFRDAADEPFGPPLIWTKVHLGEATFPIATTHLPWPLPPEPSQLRRENLVAAMPRVETGRLVLAGDFNLTPWSHAMKGLDEGLRPMRRATRALFSFPARVAGEAASFPFLPIDHLFAGPRWSVASATRLPRTGSDHYPIRVELVWRGTTSVIPDR